MESLQKPKKKTAKKPADTRTQRQRFEQFAREHGATEDVLDRAMSDVAKAKTKKS